MEKYNDKKICKGLLWLIVRNRRQYSYIVFPSETVVFDEHGKVLVKCATEEEAVEYIIDLRSEVEHGI